MLPFLRLLFQPVQPRPVLATILCAGIALALATALPLPAFGQDLPPRSQEKAKKSDKKASKRERPADGGVVLDEEDRITVDIPRMPPPSEDKYVRMDVAIDTAFVVGSQYADTHVSDTYSRFTLELGAPLSRFVAIGARARLGIRSFHFDGDGQFLDAGHRTGEPFDELLEPSVTLGTRIKLIEGLDMEIAGRVISRIEEGARFTSGVESGGSVSLLGRYRDWIVLRLGVGLGSRFDDSGVHVSPIFRLRVRLHERVWAETGGRSGRIEFTASDRVRVDLFGGVDGGRYRLEDRRDGPDGVGKGSVRLKRTDVGIGARIKLLKDLRLVVEAGAVLIQSLEIRDDDGDLFDESETREPAFRGRVALKWRF